MKSRIVQAFLALGVACLITPASGQTPAQDVSAAMQGELATQVSEGCNSKLTQYCAEDRSLLARPVGWQPDRPGEINRNPSAAPLFNYSKSRIISGQEHLSLSQAIPRTRHR